MFYAIVENMSTGKIHQFVRQEEFCIWARAVEHRRSWDIIGGFSFDILGDRSLAEHMKHWDDAKDELL